MTEKPEVANPFVFLGNHLVLDFINTVMMINGEPVDLLADAQALENWAASQGFKEPSFQVTESQVEEARGLREAIGRVLATWHDERPPNAQHLARLNRALGRRRQASVLEWRDEQLRWQQETPGASCESLLLHIAEQTAELLTRGDKRRLKGCGNERCILLFWDTSRNLSRRWCSMATCGNRSKASRHYERHHKAQS